MTRRATANILNTLTNDEVRDRLVFLTGSSDILALQEWPRRRDRLTRRHKRWTFVRPLLGGGPIGVRNSLGEQVLTVRAKRLHGPGRVDVVQGRRTHLPTTWATRVKSRRADGSTVVRYNVHLTAGVQYGRDGYRKDRPRRVARHKAERAKLQRLVNRDLDRGYAVEVYGDVNYDRMEIVHLRSWWPVVPESQRRTLGNRAIDGIWTAHKPDSVSFLPPLVPGEHRHVITREATR